MKSTIELPVNRISTPRPPWRPAWLYPLGTIHRDRYGRAYVVAFWHRRVWRRSIGNDTKRVFFK